MQSEPEYLNYVPVQRASMKAPVLEATQVGVGATAVDGAAWVLLLGGIVLAALWVRALTT